MRKLFAAAFCILVAAAPAAAQDKPVDINVGFGWLIPTGIIKDSFDTGWNGQVAATWPVTSWLGSVMPRS